MSLLLNFIEKFILNVTKTLVTEIFKIKGLDKQSKVNMKKKQQKLYIVKILLWIQVSRTDSIGKGVIL